MTCSTSNSSNSGGTARASVRSPVTTRVRATSSSSMMRRRRRGSASRSKRRTRAPASSRRFVTHAPMKPCAPGTRKVAPAVGTGRVNGSVSSITSAPMNCLRASVAADDALYLAGHVRERVVYLQLADNRALHRLPEHVLDLWIARELRRDEDVPGDHLFKHRKPRTVRRVRLRLHLPHHGTTDGHAPAARFEELLLGRSQVEQKLERFRPLHSAPRKRERVAAAIGERLARRAKRVRT